MSSSGNYSSVGGAINKLGLGYGVTVAVGILVLVSTIMLASYLCLSINERHRHGTRGAGNGVSDVPQGIVNETHLTVGSIVGLDQATVDTYPKLVYCEKQPLPQPQDPSCSICLADYIDSEVLRMLPDCRHVFHAPCIDAWLRLHASCPMCRTSPFPTPQSTRIAIPLSELVPLSSHPLQAHIS